MRWRQRSRGCVLVDASRLTLDRSIEHHVDCIAHRIAWLDAQGHATIEARDEAGSAWIEHVNAALCTRGFLNYNFWYLCPSIPCKPRIFMPPAGAFPVDAPRCMALATRG
jgi:hypothetical protein